jgi:SnoaL-like domain
MKSSVAFDLFPASRFTCGLAIVALGLSAPLMSARAEVLAEPLPSGNAPKCELHAFTPRQLVEMIYTNVVKTSPQTLDEMAKHFSPDIVFKDPVTATKGWPAYRKVYEQFMTADQLHYKVLGWACTGRTVFMSWVFGMKNKYTSNQYVEFEGISQFVVGKDNLIVLDLDSWNEIPAGYAPFIRKGEAGGVDLH